MTARVELARLLRPRSGISFATVSRLRGITGIVTLLVLWQCSVWIIALPSYFYPGPTDVWRAFVDLLMRDILPVYIAESMGRYASGVFLGTAIGVSLGLSIGLSRTASEVLTPIINFFYSIVEAVWIPLFVIWWGYGLKTVLVALIYVAMFPVLYNTIMGVRLVQPVLINACRALGATRWQVVFDVVLPAALPNIFTGFRVGAGFAFRGLIFAEMIAAQSGLGFLIFEGAANQQTDRTIVGMILIGLLWLVIDRSFLKPLEKLTIERWGLIHDGR